MFLSDDPPTDDGKQNQQIEDRLDDQSRPTNEIEDAVLRCGKPFLHP